MENLGYIRDKLDIKFLVLYILSRTAAPVDLPTLAELTFCDEGISYFDFSESVNELVQSEHISLEDGRYSITQKGRRNGEICESSLPYSVRRRCDLGLAKVNGVLRRDVQVRAEIIPREEDNTFTLRMILDDDKGNIMTLDLLTASELHARQLGETFRSRPEEIYQRILQSLLETPEEEL